MKSILISIVLCTSVLNMPGVNVWATAEEANRTAASNAAVLFLLITNSPRANGMGRCAINLVDEQSALHNPGALGLFHLNKIISVSVPNSTKWLPELVDSLRLRTFSVSAGGYSRLLMGDSAKFNLAFGLAYARLQLDYGTMLRTDSSGLSLDYSDAVDKADFFSAGIGVDYYVRIGLGITYKKIDSDLGQGIGAGEESPRGPGKADVFDVGGIIEFPVMNFFDLNIYLDQAKERPLKLELTPSVAFVQANIGDSISYVDPRETDPLPEVRKIGLGFYGALKVRNASLVALRIAFEQNHECFGSSDNTYARGGEISLFDIVAFRLGRYTDDPGQVRHNTWGAGFNVGGIARWLTIVSKSLMENETLRYFADHIDLTFDYARYGSEECVLNKTYFTKINFSL